LKRTASGRDPARRQRTKKPSIDTSKDAPGETVPTPDPATFEASFAIEDEEDESPATSEAKDKDGIADAPKSAEQQAKVESAEGTAGIRSNGVEPAAQAVTDTKETTSNDATPAAIELPADVQARLKKLDKLEKVYKSMSRDPTR
jgi:hypothetical protein